MKPIAARFQRTSAPILKRLQIAQRDRLKAVGNFGRLFHRVAGEHSTVSRQTTPLGHRFRPAGARYSTPGLSPSQRRPQLLKSPPLAKLPQPPLASTAR